jgi:membrane-associated phospholipid phosphatase
MRGTTRTAGFLLVSALASGAYADRTLTQPKPEPAQQRALPTRAENRGHRLQWTYPRFRTWQYVASGVTSGVNLCIEFCNTDYPDQTFNGPILFDSAVRDALRVRDPYEANDIAAVSDYIWYGTQYFSFLDSIITPLVFDRGNFEVAWQLSMINWQGIGLSFFVTRMAHLTVGRARPSQYGCSDDPNAEFPCKSAGPSFISGHTSMSAVGAGLACAHHQALPLYGGGLPDVAICVLLTASTLTVGTMRLMSDRHWASDVLTGLGVGGAIGVGLPYLLHYSRSGPSPLGAGVLPDNMALVPTYDQGRFGFAALGWM